MTSTFTPTPEQKAIIDLDEGCFLVTAPPGSGKTQVLTQRIVRLLNHSVGDRFRVLALTFTVRAAESMRHRIEEQAGEEWRRVTATTFHAFCLDVLQHYGEAVGVANPTIYEQEDDRVEALAQGLTEDGRAVGRTEDEVKSLKRLLASIGRLKRDLVPPEAAPQSPTEEIVSVRDAYIAYSRTVKRFGALDFDDLLQLTYRLFVESPRIAKHYRRMFKFILIDEGQDTSRAQYEILKALCGEEHRNVMIVADADQFIYRFAGASDTYLKYFQRDFGASLYSLTLNFRCATAIVNAANRLIKNNPDRLAANVTMQSETRAPGFVSATTYADEKSEGKAIVALAKGLLASGLKGDWLYPKEKGDLNPKDVCVLARTRYQLLGVVAALDEEGLDYQFASGESELLESPLFKRIYYALRVLANPKDLLSRENLIAAWEGLAEPDLQFFREAEPSVLLERVITWTDDPFGPVAKILLKCAMGKAPIDLVSKELLEVCKSIEAPDEGTRALQMLDLETFGERWKAYRQHVEEPERSLQGLLGELSLAGRAVVEGSGIRVMTVHAAKGLEYRAVFLVGMNEDSFPDFRSAKTKDGVYEERRNAYVAITRASRWLHVSRPKSRLMPWGDTRVQKPSRFIGEMGLAAPDAAAE